MDLSKLLVPGAVRIVGQMTGKKRLFQELGEVAAQAYGLNAATAIDGLQERESLGPTPRRRTAAQFLPRSAPSHNNSCGVVRAPARQTHGGWEAWTYRNCGSCGPLVKHGRAEIGLR